MVVSHYAAIGSEQPFGDEEITKTMTGISLSVLWQSVSTGSEVSTLPTHTSRIPFPDMCWKSRDYDQGGMGWEYKLDEEAIKCLR